MSAYGKKWQRVNDLLQRRRSDLALAISRSKELKRVFDAAEETVPSLSMLRALRQELAAIHKLATQLGRDTTQAEGMLLSPAPRKKPTARRKGRRPA